MGAHLQQSGWPQEKRQEVYDREQNEKGWLKERDEELRRSKWRAQEEFELAQRNAMHLVQYGPGQVGKFFAPPENTFAAHYQYVQDKTHNIHFSEKKYPLFDGMISQIFLDKRLLHPEYPAWGLLHPLWKLKESFKVKQSTDESLEGVRDNIAVVRNYLCTHLFPDGSFDPGDEAQAKKLNQMAVLLGNALQRGTTPFHKPWHYALSTDQANVVPDGAAYMYAILLKEQKGFSLFKPKTFLGYPKYDWQLPPLEKSPFGPGNLNAPPPPPPVMSVPRTPDASMQMSPPQLSAESQDMAKAKSESCTFLATVANEVEARTRRLETIEALAEPVRAESIEEAIKILNAMRRQCKDQSTHSLFSQPLEGGITQANAISKLTAGFETAARGAARINPDFLTVAPIQEARDAMGKLTYLLKLQAVTALANDGNASAASLLHEQMKMLPSSWKLVHNVTLDELLAKIEGGMHAAHIEIQARAEVDHYAQNLTNNMASKGQNSSITQVPNAQTQMVQANKNLAMDDAHQQRQQQAVQAAKKASQPAPSSNQPSGKEGKSTAARDGGSTKPENVKAVLNEVGKIDPKAPPKVDLKNVMKQVNLQDFNNINVTSAKKVTGKPNVAPTPLDETTKSFAAQIQNKPQR